MARNMMFWGGGRRRNDDGRNGESSGSEIILLIISLIAIILAPLAIPWFSWLFRQREFLADASGVRIKYVTHKEYD